MVCDDIGPDATVVVAPYIVFEVPSRSTRAYDLVEKRAAYRAIPSLRAYVIVHTDMRRVEVDERIPGGSWRTSTYDDESAHILAATCTLEGLYAESSLQTP